MTQRIALEVTDQDWKAGPAAVAEKIAEIRHDFEAKPLDQDALKAHVGKLAQHPVLNADIAQSTALQIEAAIRAFKDEAPANQLPDGFEAFEKLPPSFFAISAAFKVSETEESDRAALLSEINRLHGVIAELRNELHEKKLELLSARLTVVEAHQIRTFGEKLNTTLVSLVTLGALAGGMAWFFGVPEEELRYQALKDRLHGLAEQMQRVEPAEGNGGLPELTEV